MHGVKVVLDEELHQHGIIHDQDIRTLTSHRTTNSDSEVVSYLVCDPASSSFRVHTKRDTRKYLRIVVRSNEVTDFTSETNSEFRCMSSLNNLTIMKLTLIPRREEMGSIL